MMNDPQDFRISVSSASSDTNWWKMMEYGYVRWRQIWNSSSDKSLRLKKYLKISSVEWEEMGHKASSRPIALEEVKFGSSGRNVEK